MHMAKTLLLVESRPESAELVEEYHKWHEQIHLPEMLSVDGFVSARRWQADDGGPFVTLYEIDTDIDTARANLTAARRSDVQTRGCTDATAAGHAVSEPGRRSQPVIDQTMPGPPRRSPRS
jgi:hypothetical protein